MTVSIKSAEFQLHESLVQLQEILSLLDFDRELSDSLEESKTLIKTRKYQVAVMGEFKRGKSTLLNSLLGAPILPADATPTTAAVSRITYGQKERAILFFRDGTSREIPFDGLTDAVTKLTENGQAAAAALREAVVYYPSVICQNYIDLIDTPGLNDDAVMTQITIDLLPRIDAVIVPIHARSPFSMTERRFVCQLLRSDNIHNILFVVTFLDQLDEDDYVYEEYMEALSRRIQNEVFAALKEEEAPPEIFSKAHVLLDSLHICGLSASMALKAFASGKKSLLQESRFPEFQKLLFRSLTAGQAENALRSAADRIDSVINSLEDQNTKKLQELQRQEENLENRKRHAELFFQDLLPLLDRLLENAQSSLNAAANRLFPLKNLLMKQFIASLSHVSADTHMAIFTAIRPVVDKIPAEADAFLRENIFPAARKHFLCCLDALEKKAGESGICWNAPAFRAPLLSCMESEFQKVAFRFTKAPYPNVSDLSDADVAGYMAGCIDQSVTELYWLLKYSFSEIRRQWYPLAFRESKATENSILSGLEKEAEFLDIQKKAHLKNYPILFETAGAIQLKNRKLMQLLKEEQL